MSGGHSQLLKMTGEGKSKVDKTIKPPKGFGVVDYVFDRFQAHWRDEWRRKMVSQAGCEAIAAQWQESLQKHYEPYVRDAVKVALENTVPPTLDQFVDMVKMIAKSKKPVKQDRGYGRQQMANIRQQVGLAEKQVS